MKAPHTALLLIGSPKPGDSSSESLGGYLLEELEKRGVSTQTLKVARAVRTEEATEELHAAVAAADLIVLSFPLYIDSLPAPAIRALELIAAAAGAATSADRPGLRRHLPVRVPGGRPQRGRAGDLPQLRRVRRVRVGRRARSWPPAAWSAASR